MPVYRPAASSILRSFRASGKRPVLLTGGRGSIFATGTPVSNSTT